MKLNGSSWPENVASATRSSIRCCLPLRHRSGILVVTFCTCRTIIHCLYWAGARLDGIKQNRIAEGVFLFVAMVYFNKRLVATMFRKTAVWASAKLCVNCRYYRDINERGWFRIPKSRSACSLINSLPHTVSWSVDNPHW